MHEHGRTMRSHDQAKAPRATIFFALLTAFSAAAAAAAAFNNVALPCSTRSYNRLARPKHHALFATTDPDTSTNANTDDSICLSAVASAGLSNNELNAALSAISSACSQEGISFHSSVCGIQSISEPAKPRSLPGATGRVILLTTRGTSSADGGMEYDEEEWLLPIKYAISEQMDKALFEDSNNELNQPIMVFLRPHHESLKVNDEEEALATLISIVHHEVKEYELCKPLSANNDAITDRKKDRYVPTLHVEIDGATVQSVHSIDSYWDTSTVLVFDDLVDDDLRRGLLDVVLGKNDGENDYEWDDIVNGPDPRRWVRGGLMDVPDDVRQGRADNDDAALPCWGLSDEAVMDLCCIEHGAINDFEKALVELFPQFIVTRLPEAVLGASVSPLTANAPTFGDKFDFHIDADPYQAPPSPWTDIYGRYPNRSAGKPRFMSCLVYLNDEWDDGFGAKTSFLDPPTENTYDVMPRPGRCVLMDQDCAHKVTAPTEAAGKRPRYSLVWKLILHPRVPDQDVTDLCGARSDWPEPIFVGSAAPLKK